MTMSTTDSLVFFVNGQKVVENDPDPSMTLLTYLRTKLRLTGTKLGCAEGGCGACTVMVSRLNRENGRISHLSVNACLAPLCSVHGMAVITVEGIGSTRTHLHPVQERLANSHGSQCGFCTPGIVMSMYTLLRNNPLPSRADMESAFEGNLCRCTGYRPILDGFNSFTKEFQCAMGENCCKNKPVNGDVPQANGAVNDVNGTEEENCYSAGGTQLYDPSQEPIFPNEIQLSPDLDIKSLHFKGESVEWYRPVTLDELLELKASHPNAKIVVGNSEVGVEVKFKNMKYNILIAATHIKELNTIKKSDSGIRFGASVTLTEIEHTLKEFVKSIPEFKSRVYTSVLEILRWFAGHQIRNVACLGGNLVTASPISDLNPVLLSAGSKLTVASKSGGIREIIMDENFFISYRKTQIKPEEVLLYIDIPFTSQDEYFCAYKQAHRREDDIAIVNGALKVKFQPQSNTVQELALSFGGMAPFTKMATNTMKNLTGKKWDDNLVAEASQLLSKEMYLSPGTPGGMESYRATLTISFFHKFYLTVRKKLQETNPNLYTEAFRERDISATLPFSRPPSHGVQVFEEVVDGQPKNDPVGRPVVHLAAKKQTTGEAVYVDDMPQYSNELYMALVFSTKAHANIVNVDYSTALGMPGVHGHVTHEDIPGIKVLGAIAHDQEYLASKTVHSQGQVIGAILADTQSHAQAAAKEVKVTYEELKPIITMEQAIEAKSFMGPERDMVVGDPDKAFKAAQHVLEGEVRMGGQEHFYLETQVCLVVPKGEDGAMEFFSASQNLTEAQTLVAEFLGVPFSHIEAKLTRMGGGFGGKESSYALVLLPAAVAANKYQRPVRCMLDRDEDMMATGTRHPYLGKYKVAFSDDGKIQALDLIMYTNGGYSLDLTYMVMERAFFHCENCYKIPNIRVRNFCCRTNTPSNTAFRGFGGPQSMFIAETWITDIADTLGMTAEKVRELNLFKEGDMMVCQQPLVNCNIGRCWTEVIEKVDLEERRRQIAAFNQTNRWKKRGCAVIPTKFGAAFTSRFLNQAGALVHIYKDGSVLLTHGGTEMGQGLHTKMAQIASRVLKIPLEKVHMSHTSTALVPNTSPTAASSSSDLNGMAVWNACNTIMERLQPYIAENPKGTWEDWVTAAYMDRVSLSATGYHRTPDIHFDWKTATGHPFPYFVYGVAYSEVEIDCLTGDHNVLKTDIVMDVGRSLNPTIDIGQIEGAFIQGYGLFTLEEQRVSPTGFLYTKGPGAYKIPAFGDIPVEFNVSLLKNASNPKAVYSSKAIGEPPLFLGSSVFFAIKEAIKSAREESGLTGRFRMDSPATAEKIRMACQDDFTKQFPPAEPGTYTPWFVYM